MTLFELINMICKIFIIVWVMLSISTIKSYVKEIKRMLEKENKE